MIRLHVEADLTEGARLTLRPGASPSLLSAMRRRPGEPMLLFNGRDGEWRAAIAAISRGVIDLAVEAPLRPQVFGPDLELIAALIGRPRLETVVEKATELGVRRILLAITERAPPGEPRLDRLAAIAAEAAEQTGRMDVPGVVAAAPLTAILERLDPARSLIFCDEAGEAAPIGEALSGLGGGPAAVLIGPENGFAPTERAAIRALPRATPVTLGRRILRADTAAIAALALWQAHRGDWASDAGP